MPARTQGWGTDGGVLVSFVVVMLLPAALLIAPLLLDRVVAVPSAPPGRALGTATTRPSGHHRHTDHCGRSALSAEAPVASPPHLLWARRRAGAVR
jgi:hypothetical protein